MSKSNETQINNIRAHYEQHRNDFKESFERLLKEKCNQAKIFMVLACIGYAILIGLLILEVANPSLGWLRFWFQNYNTKFKVHKNGLKEQMFGKK